VSSITRPKVDSTLPSELVEWALQGRIRIPSFQRSYRWDRRAVTNLFDSIFRGYPIGNLLVWQRPAPPAKLTIGHLSINAPAVDNAFWIVDGQQRIISLVGALTAGDDTLDPRFLIYFDLSDEQFVSAPPHHLPPYHWMPVSITLDTALANSWIRSRPQLTDSQIATADRVVASIRDYRIPMYIVTGDDEHALRDIFDRMNTYGQSLKAEEIFNALHSVPERGEPSDLHTLASDVETFDFGQIPERILMQSLLAIRGPRIDRDFRDEFKSNADRHLAFINTERAIGQVVEFLRQIADISHIRLLPYSLYIPVLARFAAIFGPPQEMAAELLRRWVWRGAIVGVAPQGNTIALRRSASAVQGNPVSSAIRLLRLLPPWSGDWVPDLSQIGLNRVEAKISILGMLSRHPQMLPAHTEHSKIPVDVLTLLDEGRVLIPIASSGTLVKTMANRMIYPSSLSHSILRDLKSADFATLESHCIDGQAAELLYADKIGAFLEHRAASLSTIISDHVQRHALFGFRDGPDLSALFDDVEEDADAE
jgi:hypothetical protein